MKYLRTPIAIFAIVSTVLVMPGNLVLAATNADKQATTNDYTFYSATDSTACATDPTTGTTGAGGPGSLAGHTLPAASGGTGFEEPIDAKGDVPSTGHPVSFADNVVKANNTTPVATDPKHRTMQQLYEQYYITMRWRYVKWDWDGGGVGAGPEDKAFYAKAPRVLVSNPRTGKSIIAVVLESGPAPWTGVDDSPNNNPKEGWTNPQDGTPAAYKGRVSGFPPQAIKDLGATMRMQDGSGDTLHYSWAPNQAAPPGPAASSAAPVGTTDACPTPAATAPTTGSCANYTTTTSNIKILCEALKYNICGYSMGGGHQGAAAFEREFNGYRSGGLKSCLPPRDNHILDCSGLVGVSTYEAFGVDDVQVAQSYHTDKNWQHISLKDAQPGDIVWHSVPDDHVAIVARNVSAGHLVVFAARTANDTFSRNIAFSTTSYGDWAGALRYVGRHGATPARITQLLPGQVLAAIPQ